MGTEKIEVDSEKLKAFLDDWRDVNSRGVNTDLVADIIARNPHLSEIEVTVMLTKHEIKARADMWDHSNQDGKCGSAGNKLNAACRAKLAEMGK